MASGPAFASRSSAQNHVYGGETTLLVSALLVEPVDCEAGTDVRLGDGEVAADQDG